MPNFKRSESCVDKTLLHARTMASAPQEPVCHHLQSSDASPQCPATVCCAAHSREERGLSVDSSSSNRDDVAKMPSGEPISAAFLSSLLGATPGAGARAAGGAAATVTRYRVDPPSVIEGRHSTTFRLLLNPPSSWARCSEAGSKANGFDRDVVEKSGTSAF
ncbi:unnamed protein product, partial [Laminaria digitata]